MKKEYQDVSLKKSFKKFDLVNFFSCQITGTILFLVLFLLVKITINFSSSLFFLASSPFYLFVTSKNLINNLNVSNKKFKHKSNLDLVDNFLEIENNIDIKNKENIEIKEINKVNPKINCFNFSNKDNQIQALKQIRSALKEENKELNMKNKSDYEKIDRNIKEKRIHLRKN